MTSEDIWKMRGIYSQVCAVQQDVVFILTDHKLTASRKRDLVSRLEHLIEQIKAEN